MTIRVLWATPRTVSTAFERMVIERGDHLVLDEPWSRAYYFGPERRSDRFELTFPEATYAAIERGVLGAAVDRAVFVKDMAYHAAPEISDRALGAMTHTFLIREPRAAISSFARRWPDVTADEAGYVAQRALFDRVVDLTGSTPTVIDSDALRADPQRVVARWCDAVGLDHRPDALTWEPGMRPEWQLWRDWYRNAADSTGFEPPGTSPAPVADLGAPVERIIDDAVAAIAPLRDVAIS